MASATTARVPPATSSPPCANTSPIASCSKGRRKPMHYSRSLPKPTCSRRSPCSPTVRTHRSRRFTTPSPPSRPNGRPSATPRKRASLCSFSICRWRTAFIRKKKRKQRLPQQRKRQTMKPLQTTNATAKPTPAPPTPSTNSPPSLACPTAKPSGRRWWSSGATARKCSPPSMRP